MKLKHRLINLLFLITFVVGHSFAETGKQKQLEAVVALVNQHCSTCHSVPSPAVMPKESWPPVIQAMAEIAANRMGREIISAEAIRDITAFYYGSSPVSLPLLPQFQDAGSRLAFEVSELGQKSKRPLILNVNSVDLKVSKNTEFLVCDGGRHAVLLLEQSGETWRETVLAEVQVPIHTEVIDFDGDGDNDIVVADLGLIPPSDALAGKVFLLRQTAPGKFNQEVLLDNVGRVTDARPVDLDGDGDLDLAVAIFGGGVVGELAWLENLGAGKYDKHILLQLSGALNASPVDLNADGKIDIVSLVAQEHEMIVALVNRGEGKFEPVSLSRAPHPMYGSTSMSMADMDGDGDTDILFTNGDAHDTQMDPKPYHGVQWLENKGNLQFTFHNIGRFYGAAAAAAGDLDADGDMDVVASSWLNYWEDERRQSLIWFSNDGKQNFTPHAILNRPPGIVSLELKDMTGDDRLDIVAGVFRMDLLLRDMAAGTEDVKPSTESHTGESLGGRILLLKNMDVSSGLTQ